MDKNNDNFIDGNSLRQAINSSDALSPRELTKIISKCDLGEDGRLDYQAFLTAAYDHKKLLNKENIQKAFNIFDLNHDGYIDQEEFSHVVPALLDDNQAENQRWQNIIKEIDKNSDGKISLQEFTDAFDIFLRDAPMESIISTSSVAEIRQSLRELNSIKEASIVIDEFDDDDNQNGPEFYLELKADAVEMNDEIKADP